MIGARCFAIIPLALVGVAGCSQGERAGRYVGYVEAEYVYVAAPSAGWLTELTVREGAVVERGDLLFQLDQEQQAAARDAAANRAREAAAQASDLMSGARPAEISALEAQLEEARVRLRHAKLQRDRWKPLVETGNASQSRGDEVQAEYLAAAARVKAAEDAIDVAELAGRQEARAAADAASEAAAAALAEAEWRLGERAVRVRTAGRVEAIYHREGEFVVAGAPVAAVLPSDGLKVRFFAPQAELHGIEIGAPVRIEADGASAPVAGVVSFIAGEAEFTPPVICSADVRDKLVFLVEARLPSGVSLRPGLPVDVATTP